jgi:hypothetical protein
MSTLIIVEEVLREHRTPMVVREIVEVAAERLPTKSKTPDTVVARDLAMDIKRNGEASKFTRVSPGKYTLRELVPDIQMNHHMEMGSQADSAGVSSDASISTHH